MSAYSERGFVYSDIYKSPTIYDNKIVVNGSGNGSFEYRSTELSSDRSYYVRAYATNVKGTAYGATAKIYALNVYIFNSVNIMVQLADVGPGSWTTVDSMCRNSTVENFTDWRLPDKNELMSLYVNKDLIGNFSSPEDVYWASTWWGTSEIWYDVVDFANGKLASRQNGVSSRGRCVRTIDSSK